MKPRILMVVDCPNWAFDNSARQIARHLAGRFDFRFLYVDEQLPYVSENYDLIYIFFWSEKCGLPRQRVMKEVSDHPWEFDQQYGCLTAGGVVQKYLQDAGTLVTTSKRLYRRFRPHFKDVYHCRNGFDAAVFACQGTREGSLTVGWAGNPHLPQKGLSKVVRPACKGRFELLEALGDVPHEQMERFYNKLDVFLVGSRSEGEPLTLIEAMASGCFPVCTDVGIVPELINHKINGLIVDRSVEGFRGALDWCEKNLEYVRTQGVMNAERMSRTREWSIVAEDWARAFEAALDRSVESTAWTAAATTAKKLTHLVPAQTGPRGSNHPINFVDRLKADNPARISSLDEYERVRLYLEKALVDVLPRDKSTPILEIAPIGSHLLRYLQDCGYTNVCAVHAGDPLINQVRIHLKETPASLIAQDPLTFCRENPDHFGAIFIFDLLEHFTLEECAEILATSLKALKPGRMVNVLTFNGGNLITCLSRKPCLPD